MPVDITTWRQRIGYFYHGEFVKENIHNGVSCQESLCNHFFLYVLKFISGFPNFLPFKIVTGVTLLFLHCLLILSAFFSVCLYLMIILFYEMHYTNHIFHCGTWNTKIKTAVFISRILYSYLIYYSHSLKTYSFYFVLFPYC